MHNTEKDAALRAEKQKKAMETAFRLAGPAASVTVIPDGVSTIVE